jgi:hypothetical protein
METEPHRVPEDDLATGTSDERSYDSNGDCCEAADSLAPGHDEPRYGAREQSEEDPGEDAHRESVREYLVRKLVPDATRPVALLPRARPQRG